MKILKERKAFTLVELLVVISIIGLLATFAIISLNNARIRSRDSVRVTDLRTMQTALELYNDAENETNYPPTGPGGGNGYSRWNQDGVPLIDALGEYIQGGRLPIDPLHPDTLYSYVYMSDGTSYILTAYIEQGQTASFLDNDIDNSPGEDGVLGTDGIWKVWSYGAAGGAGGNLWDCDDDGTPAVYCTGTSF